MKAIWKQLYTEEGILVYEGYTLNDKAYGEGAVYYPDGKIYQQGIFDIKGLIKGKEYYPNGQLRFEGTLKINRGYGPNYPTQGCCYDSSGNLLKSGDFSVRRTGIGYPVVEKPEGYGAIPQEERPSFPILMWGDLDEEERKDYFNDDTRRD